MEIQEFIETTIRSWILAGYGTDNIVIALHNACVHGNAQVEAGEHVTDKNLEDLFDGFTLSIKAAQDMTS